LFCIFSQAVRQSRQFPTPARFNFSACCKFKSDVLRSQMWSMALSRWCLATALWGMRNAGLSCFAAGLLCRGKLLSHDISVLGLEFVWWHK
jgi:hypothetical protein